MPVDYSRFDNIVDSDDDEDDNSSRQQPPARQPAAPPPATTPSPVLEDLEDYFARLEQRRQDSDEIPSVDRFTQADVEAFETITYDASTSSYSDCAVCLSDFTDGETLTQLPCAAKHVLRPQCAIDCLTRSAFCPLCRVDLLAIAPRNTERPPTPRQLGFTRDGGVIQRYEPSPPADIPRPGYIPANLRDQASYVEIEYPEQGVARVWRVPRDAQQQAAAS